ncbi:MAG: calcium/sodium antiporter [Gammaproteobacteria bacterium]|nr:calcium/sodium antiporter [Gammaproteobacteria bacterium]NND59803.1 calcium/sodium antiporter [Gammaproteobacteria bacterium]
MTIDALDLLRLVGGLVYLVLGGDLLVRGALAVARRTAIPPVIVGLTVVALGTSAPELVISVYSSLSGFTGVAIGNVVGSNIANVLLVLGAPALISPIRADAPGLRRQTGFMLAATVIFVGLAYNGTLAPLEGLLLLFLLFAAMVSVYVFGIEVPGADEVDEARQLQRVLGLPNNQVTAIVFIVAGIVMLPLGADLTVDGAVAIAAVFGIPEVVIGSTIVALGTSLPELSTTLIAAFHRSSDIAIGNVIGSNALNILLVAGASAAIAPLPVPPSLLVIDVWILLATAALMLLFVMRRWPVGRAAGVVMLAGYVGYFTAIL